MPFVLELRDKGYIAVQGKAIVERSEAESPEMSLTIETWESMISGLEQIVKQHPVLRVMRISDLVVGLNEVVTHKGSDEPEQISMFNFSKGSGLEMENIKFVAKPTV